MGVGENNIGVPLLFSSFSSSSCVAWAPGFAIIVRESVRVSEKDEKRDDNDAIYSRRDAFEVWGGVA